MQVYAVASAQRSSNECTYFRYEVACAKRCEAMVEKESVLILTNLWQNIKTPYLAPFPK